MGLKKLLTDLSAGKEGYPLHNTPSNVEGGFNYVESTSIFDTGMIFNQKSFKLGEGRASDRRGGGFSNEPFIKINLDDVERSGLAKGIDTFTDGLIRGGAATAAQRAATDVTRISRWLLTGKGLAWNVKQVGLQASNPKISDPQGPKRSVANQRTYNLGINTISQIASSITGIHIKREGLTPLSFEGYADDPELHGYSKDGQPANENNRLVHLYGNHIQGAIGIKPDIVQQKEEKEKKWYQKALNKIGQALSKQKAGAELFTQSGGSDSIYGIGNTTIRKYSPFVTNAISYDQTPRTLSTDSKYLSGRFYPSGLLYTPGEDSGYGMFLYLTGEELPYDSQFNEDVHQPRDVNDFVGSYRSLMYYQQQESNNTAQSRNRVLDFRHYFAGSNDRKSLGSDYNTRVKGSWWKTYHREDRIGLGNPGVKAPDQNSGTPGTAAYIRTKTDAGTINYDMKSFDKIDKINMMDIVRTANPNSHWSRDLIKFRIEAVDNDNPSISNVMLFRAFLDTYTDAYNAQHNEFRYNGRAEPFFTYQGFSRDVNFSFKIAAQTRHEMMPLYRKLNYLVSQTAPEYKRGRMRAPYVKVTIGSMLHRVPGLIKSVNLTWQKDYPWEISLSSPEEGLDKKMLVLPHVLDVSVAFVPLHNFTPQRSIHAPFILPSTTNGRLPSSLQWTKKGAASSWDNGLNPETWKSDPMQQIFEEREIEEPITLDPVGTEVETNEELMRGADGDVPGETVPETKEERKQRRKEEREAAKLQRQQNREDRKEARKQKRADRKAGKTVPDPKASIWIDNTGRGHYPSAKPKDDENPTNGGTSSGGGGGGY